MLEKSPNSKRSRRSRIKFKSPGNIDFSVDTTRVMGASVIVPENRRIKVTGSCLIRTRAQLLFYLSRGSCTRRWKEEFPLIYAVLQAPRILCNQDECTVCELDFFKIFTGKKDRSFFSNFVFFIASLTWRFQIAAKLLWKFEKEFYTHSPVFFSFFF